ncbi:unnamed protein product [Microthlaspi erraticum]|uniref:Uncharacterized protein n=1 Tax=Microthlaspi erraticum TaxID=1685480 RepID=A0A6D2JPS1_9BRAS|nr:unnamed protein product [Microthlaspi erraticum]
MVKSAPGRSFLGHVKFGSFLFVSSCIKVLVKLKEEFSNRLARYAVIWFCRPYCLRAIGQNELRRLSHAVMISPSYLLDLPTKCDFMVAWSQRTTAPYGLTSFILNGPDHLERSLPGKSLSLELKSRTWSFAAKDLGTIFYHGALWSFLVDLAVLVSQVSDLSSSSFNWIRRLSAAVLRLKLAP